MEFHVLVTTMLQLLIIVILGYFLGKYDLIDENVNVKLSRLIAQVTCPVWVVSSVLTATKENRLGILVVIISGFIMYALFVLFAKFAVKIMRYPEKERPLYENMLIFSSNSFIGFPIIQSLLGTKAIFYTAMIHFAFNFFIFSYGVITISNCKEQEPFEEQRKTFDWKMLINPGFILSILALIIYLIGLRTDGVFYKTTLMVGNLTPPLSMLLLGYSLTKYPILDCTKNWKNFMFSFVRLFIIPTLSFFCCKSLKVSHFYTVIVTITNAMPVASLVLIIGNQAGVNTKVILENMFLSTALATLTVPIVGALFL